MYDLKTPDLRFADAVFRTIDRMFRRATSLTERPLTTIQETLTNYNGTIQGYGIYEKIASGNNSNIFRAVSKEGQEVAIKFPKHRLVSSYGLEEFKSEILPITHDLEGCVHVLDIIMNSSFRIYGVVMEMITDPTLQLIQQNRGVSIINACKIIVNLCESVEKIHQKGILNRDLKPANIFVDEKYGIKICDFGSAIKMKDGRVVDEHGVGTIDYIAPEQYPSPNSPVAIYGVSADIYSIGTIFYELLANQLPFSEGDCQRKLSDRKELKPRHIDWVRSDIPKSIQEVVMKSIDRSSSLRQQSAQELADDIKRAVEI